MPRDLFGDIGDPSVHLGTRSRYTLPLSLLAHVAALVAVLMVPLMATGMLPLPRSMPVFVSAPAVPVPPPPPPRLASPQRPAQVSADAAPSDAPAAIVPETGLEAGFETSMMAMPDTVAGTVVGELSSALPSPPPPPAPQVPVRVGGKIAPPAKVHDVAPVYPAIAQAARVQGVVILQATIDAAGRVSGVTVLRSIPLLDQAAVAAVREWEYSPTLLNGVPVAVVMTVTVSFALR